MRRLLTNKPDQEESQDGSKGQGLGGPEVPRDRVKNAPNNEKGHREESWGQHNVPNPFIAPNILVKRRRDISSHKWRHRVEDNQGGFHRATIMGVVETNSSEDEDSSGDNEELGANSKDRAEEGFVGGESENITVNQLPAIFIGI